MVASVPRRALPLLLLLAAGGAIRPSATSVFVATVANALTNEPIPDAEVSITDLPRVVRTNWIGEGVIAGVSQGHHHVRVRRVGFAEAELDIVFDRDTIGVFFRLSPRPQTLDTVKTAATSSLNLVMGEFERRRRMGIGRFLTDSILRADSTQPLASILERRIPGLVSVDDGRRVIRSSVAQYRPDCHGFDTYIDGERVSTPAYSLSSKSKMPAPDDTDLRFLFGADVAGVE